MTTREAIDWFKKAFHSRIADAVARTPFTADLLAAIAHQETGYIWRGLVKKGLKEEEVLKLCVGDTLDCDGGRACFPKNKADLLAAPRGAEMFAIARQALVAMAKHSSGYEAAVRNREKFCHGFGIFQYDIQFFKKNPEYFLRRSWEDFDACLTQCVEELKEAMRRQGWAGKSALTDEEQVFVAIAYNKGTAKCSLGFKQGHKCDGRWYGENVFEFLRIAQGIPVNGEITVASPQAPNAAPLPPPTAFDRIRAVFEVDVRHGPLRLRSAPCIPRENPDSNIIARLPDGHLVQRAAVQNVGEFMVVETSLNGAYYRGFAAAKYLRRVLRAKRVRKPKAVKGDGAQLAVAERPAETLEVLVPLPENIEPTSGIVAVYMPRNPGSVTSRSAPAGAHSLNEEGQPARNGETAAERCAELAAIVDWLAVDKPSHKRYRPRAGSTFCNIYAHDYCFLAGLYLPRVWWTPDAIERLATGNQVAPRYEKTIDEQRANDLFRWFRAFGLRFGWRQTSTLTKLQEAANLGGIGIIIARRKLDGKSGHIVVVPPETDEHNARRNAAGEVVFPLQSQAGVANFRYRAVTKEWWKGEQFADNALWIHA